MDQYCRSSSSVSRNLIPIPFVYTPLVIHEPPPPIRTKYYCNINPPVMTHTRGKSLSPEAPNPQNAKPETHSFAPRSRQPSTEFFITLLLVLTPHCNSLNFGSFQGLCNYSINGIQLLYSLYNPYIAPMTPQKRYPSGAGPVPYRIYCATRVSPSRARVFRARLAAAAAAAVSPIAEYNRRLEVWALNTGP